MSDAAERAAKRIDFQLTYARSEQAREFTPGWLSGPQIADAFRPGSTASGEWSNPDDEARADLTEDEWIERFASYAINEAIHEALEWFQVDGRPWLSPHGKSEDMIYVLTNRLCAELAELRSEDVGGVS